MAFELVKDKVFCNFFAKDFTDSTGIYNIHTQEGENLIQAQQNLDVIKSHFNASAISILKQIHSNVVVEMNHDNYRQVFEADASLTNEQGLILAILTADCVPVLFSSIDGSVIAAAHCGWRGAKAGIIRNVSQMMKNDGVPEGKVVAAIGPAIHQKSYEVDNEYYKSFLSDDIKNEEFFIASHRPQYWMFDLVAFVKSQLLAENITVTHFVDEDTYALPEKYPSYRFCQHNNVPYSSNILSTIVIKK